ncbi:hypothetical protein ABT116_14750 [Streptomyces sp. NPDC002130]|uniref:hypothetical protein n=1 Tax=Streptomyces sp. NPDC002130 TaxID=3155568 RepID=UPI0033319CF2
MAGQQGDEEVDAGAGEFALAADLVRDAAGEFVPQQLGVEAVAVPAVLLEAADGVPEPGRGDLVVGDGEPGEPLAQQPALDGGTTPVPPDRTRIVPGNPAGRAPARP